METRFTAQTDPSHLRAILQALDESKLKDIDILWRDLQHVDLSPIQQDISQRYGIPIEIDFDDHDLTSFPSICVEVEYGGKQLPDELRGDVMERLKEIGLESLDLSIIPKLIYPVSN